MNFSEEEGHYERCYYDFNIKTREFTFFDSKKTKGLYRGIIVKAAPLDLPEDSTEAVDDDMVQFYMLGREYPAWRWHSKYDALRDKMVRYGDHYRKKFIEQFKIFSTQGFDPKPLINYKPEKLDEQGLDDLVKFIEGDGEAPAKNTKAKPKGKKKKKNNKRRPKKKKKGKKRR